MNPMVSVIMPLHNGERYVRQAIESLCAQTYPDWELIVVDDASTDNSYAIARSFKSPKIKTIRTDRNLGHAAAANRAIGISSGAYIARLDCDDVCLPQRLEKQVNFLQRHASIGVIGARAQTLDDNGCVVMEKPTPHPFPEEPSHIAWRLLWHNCIVHSSVMLRKESFNEAGGYDETFWYASDHELWSRMSFFSEFCQLPEVLVQYRQHGGAQTATLGAEKQLNEKLLVCKRGFDRLLGREISPLVVQMAINGWRGCGPRLVSDLESHALFLEEVYRTFCRSRRALDHRGMKMVQKDMVRSMCLLQFYQRDLTRTRDRRWLLELLKLLPIESLKSKQFIRQLISGSVIEDAYVRLLAVKTMMGNRKKLLDTN
jgi:hypothetical protein